MQGRLSQSVGGLRSQGGERCGCSAALVSGLHHHLFLLHYLHEFDPDKCLLGGVERFEPEHGPCHPLDGAMVLFHAIAVSSCFSRTSGPAREGIGLSGEPAMT